MIQPALGVLAAAALLGAALGSAGVAGAKTILPGFHSPSGSIRCFYIPGARGGPAVLHCDVARAAYGKTLQDHCMAGPSVDWHGFELGAARKGAVVCSGGILYNPDTQRPSFVNLPYGKSWRHGVFTCSSRAAGVTCRNRTGHGLFISRQSWRVW